ncbi:single-stranded DNA-binding protein [Gallibacterium anatis]|uniref:Single-stranded DNA-binding protein n=1 Tax=Gallibacterium anatis TaxID=750 RepID=A0AAX3XGS8_9PAST|nr:single-stranded DNA-binding protein [Gallibacterium anatis]MDK9560745.1 single-stranded DNA-binding protein [Gallibacterium anatis]WIM80160.1 single-stranded DNA-binding protein [Gallibacterium anatis]
MPGVNQVNILGNLGDAPQVRYMPNGDLTAMLSVATSRVWKDKNGERQELTEWHRIVLYRRLAEIAKDYLHKGSKVFVIGYLRTQKWTDDKNIDRWTTSIIGEQLQLISSKPVIQQNKQTEEHISPEAEIQIIEDEPPPF